MLPNMMCCMQENQGVRQIDSDRIAELVTELGVAEVLEDQAIRLFQVISEQYPDRKRTTLPRWGAHSPR